MSKGSQMEEWEAREESEKLKKMVDNGEVDNYGDAERIVDRDKRIGILASALESLEYNEHLNNNVVYDLYEANLDDLGKKALSAVLKKAILECIRAAEILLDPNTNESDLGSIIDLNMHDDSFYAYQTAKIVSGKWDVFHDVIEILGNLTVRIPAPYLEEDNREEFERKKDLATKLAREFLMKVKNNPILKVDDGAIFSEVKKGIEQKLIELKA